MMIKTDWSLVPSLEVNKPTLQDVGGVTVEVSAAYFDVPQAARFIYDESSKQLVIDFRYLTTPEITEVVSEGDVSLLVGKNTRRIYQIRVAADSLHNFDANDRKISFNLVVDADKVFKEKMSKFSDINRKNSNVVDSFLDWGIQHKKLNLQMTAG